MRVARVRRGGDQRPSGLSKGIGVRVVVKEFPVRMLLRPDPGLEQPLVPLEVHILHCPHREKRGVQGIQQVVELKRE